MASTSVLLVILAISVLGAFAGPEARTRKDWKEFKGLNGKKYTGDDEKKRYEIYTKRVAEIEEHNKEFADGKSSYEVKVNKLADWTDEEMNRLRGLRPPTAVDQAVLKATPVDTKTLQAIIKAGLPAEVDWRKKNAVTPVKDQGYCGSCWAFAAVAALESHEFIKNRNLPDLSEQQLIDCTYDYDGCDGGWYYNAWDYLKRNGIATEASYPNKQRNSGSCKYKPRTVSGIIVQTGTVVTGWVQVPSGNETALMAALTLGPVAVAIDANDNFAFYSKGVYYSENCNNYNHAVLVVGYGTTPDGKDYYIVKNSWGTSWGDDGYILMARNRNNNCLIASFAYYPIMRGGDVPITPMRKPLPKRP